MNDVLITPVLVDVVGIERGLRAVLDEICYSNEEPDWILDSWVYVSDLPRLVEISQKAAKG